MVVFLFAGFRAGAETRWPCIALPDAGTALRRALSQPDAGSFPATETARRLGTPDILVNNIAPGMVLTPMNREAMDDLKACREQAGAIPWKRPAEPGDVARLGVYLASDDADYATGQTFTLDGGLAMNVGQGA